MSVDWSQKIVAYLHDPPDKQLDRGGHEDRALGLIGIALGQEIDKQDPRWQRAKWADRTASAADRLNLEGVREARVDFVADPRVTHVLAGSRLKVPRVAQARPRAAHEIQEQAVEVLMREVPSDNLHRRYLRLWRNLSEALVARDTAMLGADWTLLPADSRMPDHSLLEHVETAAALATALPAPAFLVFSLGPVQEFIRTARRTQDLWMGSYLLAYLTWQAMRAIADEAGPDAILYPALRGQPLADWWLHQENAFDGVPSLELRRMATFPNRFVALLAHEDAPDLAKAAAQAVHQAWEEIASDVRRFFGGIDPPPAGEWDDIWRRQTGGWPHIYWAIYPWPEAPEQPDVPEGRRRDADWARCIRDAYERLFAPPVGWSFGQLFDFYWRHFRRWMNAGTVYNLLQQTAQRGLDARKGLRDVAFRAQDEAGEKCTLCGRRAALHDNRHPDEYWLDVAAFLRQPKDKISPRYRGLMAALKPEGQERLCAICAIKRFVQRAHLDEKLGLRNPFPSTSSVAVAPFQARVLKKILDTEGGAVSRSLGGALEYFIWALENVDVTDSATGQLSSFPTIAEETIPYLTRLRVQFQGHPLADTVARFLRYDGDLLFPETYVQDRLRKDYGLWADEQTLDDLKEGVRGLLEQAEKAEIPPPSRYFAVLMMDGDEMSRWLAGERAPRFRDVLHPVAVERLEALAVSTSNNPENNYTWKEVLDQRRMVSPALHTAISRALATFALEMVPWVVEQRYPGRVVYAGGDDVLAFLPAECALAAARELRALFSGETERSGDDGLVRLGVEGLFGYVQWPDGRLLPTMGPRASASAGIAMAHHTDPLDLTLEAARQAERLAKRQYGRNALVVCALKRSGAAERAGLSWYYTEQRNGEEVITLPDAADIIEQVRAWMAGRQLSGKFAYDVQAEAEGLATFLESTADRPARPEAVQAELRRLLKRHRGQQITDDELDRMAHQLTDLATALHGRYERWREKRATVQNRGGDEPPSGTVELACWLRIARFMTRIGGEA